MHLDDADLAGALKKYAVSKVKRASAISPEGLGHGQLSPCVLPVQSLGNRHHISETWETIIGHRQPNEETSCEKPKHGTLTLTSTSPKRESQKSCEMKALFLRNSFDEISHQHLDRGLANVLG